MRYKIKSYSYKEDRAYDACVLSLPPSSQFLYYRDYKLYFQEPSEYIGEPIKRFFHVFQEGTDFEANTFHHLQSYTTCCGYTYHLYESFH